MNSDALFVLILAGAALALFATEVVAPDIVGLLVLVSLGLSGIMDLPTLFSGFSRPIILTLIGIFMLTAALEQTGVTAYVGQQLLRLLHGTGERTQVGLLAIATSIASFTMNSVAAVSLVLPIGRHIAHQHNTSPSRLLMPIAFGGLLGGMATLLTTSNLLLADLLTQRHLPTLGLLDFLPVGGPIALLGVLYLALFGPSLLPERSPADDWGSLQKVRQELTETYALEQRLFEARIPPGSTLVGETLIESRLGHDYGLTVVALVRGRQTFAPPQPAMRLQAGDWLLFGGRPDDATAAAHEMDLVLSARHENQNEALFASAGELAEVVLSPRTSLAGQTLNEIRFREKYGLNVLAVWHAGRPFRSRLTERRLDLGDALLVLGTPDRLSILSKEPDFLVLTRLPDVPEHSERAIIAIAILIAFLIVIAFNWLPVALAALLAAIGVVVTGCESIEQARASIQWPVLFVIGGMVPLATAFEQTGVVTFLAKIVLRLLELGGPKALLLALFLLTTGLTQLTSGVAATLIIGPLAITTAQHNGLNPQTLAIAVGISASTAFLSPISHPANLLVKGPGGYHFRDYAKLGLPLVALVGLGIVFLLPLVYPP